MLSIADTLGRDAGASRSQAGFAYDAIRAGILAGRHGPDKKLKIQDLALELGVSPGAVREALSRLVPEQLVVSREQRGFAVAPLSVADLEDLTDLRCEVESIAIRRSVANGGVDWEAGLLAAAHRLHATVARAEDGRAIPAGWVAAHAAFHNALIGAAGSRRLLALHAQLYEQSERYRGLSANLETARDVQAEHRELVDLALKRDADALVAATVRHLRVTTRLIVEAAKRNIL